MPPSPRPFGAVTNRAGGDCGNPGGVDESVDPAGTAPRTNSPKLLPRGRTTSAPRSCRACFIHKCRLSRSGRAIESARVLGYLLAQQLVAASESVVDVPPTLSAVVRVLGSGKSSKNDPNDALSTAVAALRGRRLREVSVDDHRAILRLLADRHHDPTALRTQAACPAPRSAR